MEVLPLLLLLLLLLTLVLHAHADVSLVVVVGLWYRHADSCCFLCFLPAAGGRGR